MLQGSTAQRKLLRGLLPQVIFYKKNKQSGVYCPAPDYSGVYFLGFWGFLIVLTWAFWDF